jgi:thiol-disulfide isomerase/thioredoxin
MALFARTHMPQFEGAAEWLNSGPLGPDDLRGHVVVADFWTLTCINWLRTEPYVRAWSQAYRSDGLIVVGVHTPEFTFEHELRHVQRAVTERAIDYPVALDNGYRIWRAFDNHYWPALYFIDTDGVIRDQHFGEGRYEQSEREIQKLLGIERELVDVVGVGPEAEADWDNLRSPETYLGSSRSERFAGDATPDRVRLNQWSLDGAWSIGREKVVAGEAGASIAFRFHARDAHLVLAHDEGDPILFRVELDDQAPGASHGVDLDEEGNGVLDASRMYQLVRQPGEVVERTLRITFLDPGAEAYVFTFG